MCGPAFLAAHQRPTTAELASGTTPPFYAHNAPSCMSDDVRNLRSEPSSVDQLEREADRERLEDRSLLLVDEENGAPEVPTPDVDALRALVEKVNCQCAPYQSMAVAAVQILERALRSERQAAEAALSLGQQEKMESMVETAHQAVSILRGTLNPQGHKVMSLCAQESLPDPTWESQSSGQPWWFVLSDALEVLEEGTEQMTTLTMGQASGSPTRELSQLIAQLLRSHHDALLLEAEEWIS